MGRRVYARVPSPIGHKSVVRSNSSQSVTRLHYFTNAGVLFDFQQALVELKAVLKSIQKDWSFANIISGGGGHASASK